MLDMVCLQIVTNLGYSRSQLRDLPCFQQSGCPQSLATDCLKPSPAASSIQFAPCWSNHLTPTPTLGWVSSPLQPPTNLPCLLELQLLCLLDALLFPLYMDRPSVELGVSFRSNPLDACVRDWPQRCGWILEIIWWTWLSMRSSWIPTPIATIYLVRSVIGQSPNCGSLNRSSIAMLVLVVCRFNQGFLADASPNIRSSQHCRLGFVPRTEFHRTHAAKSRALSLGNMLSSLLRSFSPLTTHRFHLLVLAFYWWPNSGRWRRLCLRELPVSLLAAPQEPLHIGVPPFSNKHDNAGPCEIFAGLRPCAQLPIAVCSARESLCPKATT